MWDFVKIPADAPWPQLQPLIGHGQNIEKKKIIIRWPFFCRIPCLCHFSYPKTENKCHILCGDNLYSITFSRRRKKFKKYFFGLINHTLNKFLDLKNASKMTFYIFLSHKSLTGHKSYLMFDFVLEEKTKYFACFFFWQKIFFDPEKIDKNIFGSKRLRQLMPK